MCLTRRIVFFANAGIVGAKYKNARDPKLIADTETSEIMETFRVNTLRYV